MSKTIYNQILVFMNNYNVFLCEIGKTPPPLWPSQSKN